MDFKQKPKLDSEFTQLERIKKKCKAQGFDYDSTPFTAEYDTFGNILKIRNVKNVKLQAILQSEGIIMYVDHTHDNDWIDPSDADLNKMIEGLITIPKLLRPETKKEIMEIINQVVIE